MFKVLTKPTISAGFKTENETVTAIETPTEDEIDP
jgi:hypothetical protein